MSEFQKTTSFDWPGSSKVWDIGWSLLENILKYSSSQKIINIKCIVLNQYHIELILSLIIIIYLRDCSERERFFFPWFIKVGQSSTSIINWPNHDWTSGFVISTVNFSISSKTGSTWNFESDKLWRISNNK